MKYSSYNYLYSTLIRNKMGNETINTIFDIFGNDFYIEPGSLNYLENEQKSSKYVECSSFKPQNKELKISKICFEGYKANISIYGNYNNLPIKIEIRPKIWEKYATFEIKIIEPKKKGIYMFYSEKLIKEPCIIHYDIEAYECLRNNYNLKNEEILEENYGTIGTLGISPDESLDTSFEKLKVSSSFEFINKILTTMKCSELLDLFQELLNNYSTEKEKTKVKQ